MKRMVKFLSLILSILMCESVYAAETLEEKDSLQKTLSGHYTVAHSSSGSFGSLVFTSEEQLKQYFQESLKATSLDRIGLLVCTASYDEQRTEESIQHFVEKNKKISAVICIQRNEKQEYSENVFISIPYEILSKKDTPVALVKIPSNYFVLSEKYEKSLIACADQDFVWKVFSDSQTLWEQLNNKMIQKKMHPFWKKN